MTQTATLPPWYLIYTHPKQESRTVNNLRSSEIETFCPQIREWRVNEFTGEARAVIKPLFARYIFSRFDLGRLFHKVRYTRGVNDLVNFGQGPVEISEDIIEFIRSQTDKEGFVKIADDLKPGDTIKVVSGPLKDLSGIFERRMSDSDRVMVLLNTATYQAHLQMDQRLLQKIGEPAAGGRFC